MQTVDWVRVCVCVCVFVLMYAKLFDRYVYSPVCTWSDGVI